MDHGCYILGGSGRNLQGWAWKLGILCHHLLYWGFACHHHSNAQKKSSCRWWAWWTKTFQDHFIFPLRLLLVFLRCYFCSGGLRSYQARVLRRNYAWLVASEPLCGVRTLCRDNKRFKNTKKSCPAPSKRRLQNLQSEPQFGTLDLQLSPLLRPKYSEVRSSQSGPWDGGGKLRIQDVSGATRHVSRVTCQFVVIIPLLFLAILSWWVRRKRLKLFRF